MKANKLQIDRINNLCKCEYHISRRGVKRKVSTNGCKTCSIKNKFPLSFEAPFISTIEYIPKTI